VPYLFAAYCVFFLVIFVYLLSLSRRQRALSQEIEALRQRMERKEKQG
jgi:CcmD family protein